MQNNDKIDIYPPPQSTIFFRDKFVLTPDHMMPWENYRDYYTLLRRVGRVVRLNNTKQCLRYYELVNLLWRKNRLRNADFRLFMQAFASDTLFNRVHNGPSQRSGLAGFDELMSKIERMVSVMYKYRNFELIRPEALDYVDPPVLPWLSQYEASIDRRVSRILRFFNVTFEERAQHDDH